MKFEMQRASDSSKLIHKSWDVIVIGEDLDERGIAAKEFARKHCTHVVECGYNPDTFELRLNGATFQADNAEHAFKQLGTGRILLEATTLGFAEVYLACRALRANGIAELSLLYVEPLEYSGPRNQLLRLRDFELSDEVPGYIPVPGATILLEDRRPQRGVFFLGYEERRLDRAMEDHPIVPSRTSVVFGVPAFQPGWEMDAFANNARVLRDRNISGGVHFCGAQNPLAAYEILVQVNKEREVGEEMFVAPIGTKPHGIAAALFAAENVDVGILYDHPKRRQKRTSKVSSWHLFDVAF
jgi:hypothetical protein